MLKLFASIKERNEKVGTAERGLIMRRTMLIPVGLLLDN
jgi:hypothetical protein